MTADQTVIEHRPATAGPDALRSVGDGVTDIAGTGDDMARLLRLLERAERDVREAVAADARAAGRYRRAFAARAETLTALVAAPAARRVGLAEGAATRARFGGAARVLGLLRDLPSGRGDASERDDLAGRAADAGSSDALCGACCASLLVDAVRVLESDGAAGSEFEPVATELLDTLDALCLDDADALLRASNDYLERGRGWRARRLLRTHLERVPDDAVAAARYARALAGRSEPKRAAAAFDAAADLAPDDAALLHEGALEHARTGDVDAALSRLERAAALAPRDAAVAGALARACRLARCVHEARPDDAMPTLSPDEDERGAGRFDVDALAVAARLYRKYGTLQLDGVFDAGLIDACRAEFMRRSRRYFEDGAHEDALRIGDRRFQVGVELAGAFADPGFYANPYVLGVMRALLGEQLIIGSAVCATSLPGSADQHLHKDHRAIFTTDEDDEPPELPPVAVTLMIPLVALDEEIGTTLVRKGSHRRARRASARLPAQAPLCRVGSCFLMDLSLSHQGRGNRTERVRPIVNMQYTRRWFVDNKNFTVQPPLRMPADAWERVPDRHRGLLSWAAQPPARVGA